MTKQISNKILAEIAKGFSVQEAFDRVLGVGRYQKLASDVYAELRCS